MAQTGSITPTGSQLGTLPVDQGGKVELIEEPVVDLRQFMPPVGEQKVNDCTAWAAAWAKSYNEGREQGWLPSTDGRIFSPTFIYNQVNKGKDEGSNIVDVVMLMKSKGAATLARTPYDWRDILQVPNPLAFTEAQAFPIADFYLLRTSEAIRRTLQRRNVVVFGAHVGPVFMSGKWDVYTRETFVRDNQIRTANQPHGKHAMVIVGYDDSKKAFLLQNSWGTKWAKRGYAYVGYDLFDEIRPTGSSNSEGVFCNWAGYMVDVEEPLEPGPQNILRPKPLDPATLKIGGFADIRRFDPDRKKFVYTLIADLRGQPAMLASVKQIKWVWTNALGVRKERTRVQGTDALELIDTTDENPANVVARVTFNDGTERVVERDIVGQNPKAQFRTATATFEDQYWGKINDGKLPIFQFKVGIDVPLNEQNEVKKVVYNLGDMDRAEPVRVSEGFNGPPAVTTTAGLTDKSNPVLIDIHYRDGGIKRLELIPGITDDVIDAHRILASARQIGVNATGRKLYAVTLSYDRPRQQDSKIRFVRYELSPHFETNVIDVVDTFGDYEAYTITDRDFRVRATPYFDNAAGDPLPGAPVELWVTITPQTRFEVPQNVELAARDIYLGQSFGQPFRRNTFQIAGDYLTLNRIAKVEYVLPLDVAKLWNRSSVVIEKGQSPTFFLDIDKTEAADQPITLQANVTYDDGTSNTFKITHTPSSPMNDNRGFKYIADNPKPGIFSQEESQRYARKVRLLTSELDGWRVRGLRVRGVVNGYLVDETMDYARTSGPGDLAFAVLPESPTTLEAIVTDSEGYEESIPVTLLPGVSREIRPTLDLRVREKLWSLGEDGPKWIGVVSLAGDQTELSKIRSATIAVTSLGDDQPWQTFTLDKDFTQEQAVVARDRSAVVATLVMIDGSTQTFTKDFRCETVPGEDLAIALNELMAPPQGYVANTLRELRYSIQGHEELLRKIKSVTYKLDEQFSSTAQTRETNFGANFALRLVKSYGPTVAALITFDDGTTRTLEAPARLTDRKPAASVKAWPDVNAQTRVQFSLDAWPFQYQNMNFSPDRFGNAFAIQESDQHKWLFWPSQTVAYTVPGSRVTLDQIGNNNTGVLDSTGRAIALPPALSTEQIRLMVNAHPIRKGEWVARIDGPISKLVGVSRVTYRYTSALGRDVSIPITHRWGETSDTFEHRIRAEAMPKVTATVERADGSTIELK